MPKKVKSKRKSTRAGTPARSAKPSARAIIAAANRSDLSLKERLEAVEGLSALVCREDKAFRTASKLLQDVKQPAKIRLAALETLQTASFSVVAFAPCKSEYIAALRAVAEDANADIRSRVLGILTREADPYAQERLIEGLRNTERALLPPEKALQLLATHVHSDAWSVAKEVLENPPNVDAKREAVRVLASDATAAPMIESILRNKDEFAEVRQASAAALNAIDPQRFHQNAREIVLDTTDYPEIQSASLTALTNFAAADSTKDRALRKRISKMQTNKSELVQESARQFLSKHGE